MDGIYSRNTGGYSVIATNACSRLQGGVALCWRENDRFVVEEQRTLGANVITCQMVTGHGRYYLIGCYLPPSDTTVADDMEKAIEACPRTCTPLLLGDLNINFEHPRDPRDEKVAEILDAYDFLDTTRCFRQHCQYNAKGRWTWRQRWEGRWISSQPDYLMGRRKIRRRLRKVGLRFPRHHDSDHRAIVLECMWKRYYRKGMV